MNPHQILCTVFLGWADALLLLVNKETEGAEPYPRHGAQLLCIHSAAGKIRRGLEKPWTPGRQEKGETSGGVGQAGRS